MQNSDNIMSVSPKKKKIGEEIKSVFGKALLGKIEIILKDKKVKETEDYFHKQTQLANVNIAFKSQLKNQVKNQIKLLKLPINRTSAAKKMERSTSVFDTTNYLAPNEKKNF